MGALMRTYIDVTFHGDGVDPLSIAKDMETLGLKPIRGEHDFYFDWTTDEEFRKMVMKIHEIFKGKKISYRLKTLTEEELIAEANFVISYR